jgi:phospholipase D1/2
MSFVFDKVKGAVQGVENKLKGKPNYHAHTTHGGECSDGDSHHMHRFQSFAPQREGKLN